MKSKSTTDAKYWYEWGNEGTGYVSVGYYDDKDVWVSCGVMKKESAVATLQFHNPYH